MSTDGDHADYREVFGKDPEPWRGPLGALRLTLVSDEPWTLERARAECEELVRVLNDTQAHDAQVWDEGAKWAAVELGAIPNECAAWLASGDNPYRED